jgi:hypothetical protein
MDDRALPSADPSPLPAVRERGGALGPQFVDVFVGFRLRFHDESEAGAFARHFRFASSRSALRQEGGGVVWVGFHGWAFDAADAQTQAALAVRHSALRARIRHIPAATDAELRPTDRRLVDVAKARREREELLARISEEVPDTMINANRPALGAGARRISSGQRQAPTGQRASTPPPSSGSPPGAASGSSAAKPAKGRRRLFGR